MKTIEMAKDFIFNAIFNDANDTMPITHLLADYLDIDYNRLKNEIELIPRELEVGADKITEKVETISKDSDYVTLNDEYEKTEQDIASARNAGHYEGYVEGAKQKAIETAKKMLNDKLDLDIISKYSGLSVKEIESLK